jgi:penicillin-binding protein 1A
VRSLLRLVLVLAALSVLTAGTVVALAPATTDFAGGIDLESAGVDLDSLDSYSVKSLVFASDGSKIGEFFAEENREPVALPFIPKEVIDPILAMEDQHFYEHTGVNLQAILRALFQNVSSGSVEQGGSTITQQLVKNALLNSEKELDRKTREAVLALWVEDHLTKDEILEKYLNTVYFGSGAYGVQAAAEIYWGKNISELGWAEGALLAGLISNPSRYDPTRFPERAIERRRITLDTLVEQGKLTRAEADFITLVPLPTERCGTPEAQQTAACGDKAERPPENYFVEDVKQELLDAAYLGDTPEERYEMVFGGGLRIFTTIDLEAQRMAEESMAEGIPDSMKDKGIVGSMISVEPGGAVRAMVGGPGFDQLEYNIATADKGRPTGSSFKTFVLLTALEQGATPNDSIAGGGTFKPPGEKPYQVDGKGGTITSVTQASSNGAFVRLGQIVGLENVVEVARKLGVTTELNPAEWSMPLGPKDIPPVQMASAYSAITNGGIHEPYYFIERIEDRDGNVIYEHTPHGNRAVSRQTACLAAQILAKNVTGGTGTRARLDNQVAGGKTGTTQAHHDVWFVGFTPYLTTAVWLGDPLNKSTMSGSFGGNYPATIWGDFNEKYHEGREPLSFPKCDKVGKAKTLKLSADKVSGGSTSSSSTKKKPTTSTTRPPGGGTATTAPPATDPPPTDPPPTNPPPTNPPPTEPPNQGGGP